MRSTFSKKTSKKRNLITNGSKNMILENPYFLSVGLFRYFGVGGSIRLAKLVCLLLARASQVPYIAENIMETLKNQKITRKRN